MVHVPTICCSGRENGDLHARKGRTNIIFGRKENSRVGVTVRLNKKIQGSEEDNTKRTSIGTSYDNHSTDEDKRSQAGETTREEVTRKCNTLPRLYVGDINTRYHHTCSSSISMNSSCLQESRRVQLSMEQTHYLTKVMRFFKKRRKKKRTDIDGSKISNTIITVPGGALVDVSQCVRLFDGINGEWLAKVIDPLESPLELVQTSSSSSSSSRSRKQSTKQNKNMNNMLLEAQCLIQLRHQQTKDKAQQRQLQKPWLIFAPIKKQRLKLMVEKCTELGTELFCPVMTDHTEASNTLGVIDYSSNDIIKGGGGSDVDNNKLPLIACEAAEQSERLTVPTFVSPCDFDGDSQSETATLDSTQDQYWNIDKLLESMISSPLFAQRTLLICRERKHNTVPILRSFDIVQACTNDRGGGGGGDGDGNGVVLLIGPEGGWSERENKLFDEYNLKYPDKVIMCVSLGSSIVLRAETAAIAAVGAYALWTDNQS